MKVATILGIFLFLSYLVVSMGGRAEGLACADPGARTPIGVSGIRYIFGPSGVRALPLAAGINVGGHYF